jgi:phospholipid/cholesterol/gamma-HCH transport system substrate-binding protein
MTLESERSVNSTHTNDTARGERLTRRPLSTRLSGFVQALAVAAVLALVALVGLDLRMRQGWRFVRGPEYQAAFGEVTGLAEGAKVRYAGLDVGRVRRVTIDSTDARRVVVTFRVRDGTPITLGTRATIVGVGSTPPSFLNLRPGTALGAPLPAGSRIASDEGLTLQATLERVALVLDRTDALLVAAQPLTDGAFFTSLGRTTARLDSMATTASRGMHRWGPRLAATAAHTEQLLARTDRLLAVLDSARPALAAAPGEMTAMLKESRALLSDVRAGVTERGGLRQVMRDLAAATDDLARLSARLERNPVSVLQARRPGRKEAGPTLHN